MAKTKAVDFFGKKDDVIQNIDFTVDHIPYHFTATKEATVKRSIIKKRVYVGQFLSTGENSNSFSPRGCKLDTPYCLKVYDIDLPIKREPRPQNREFLDLLPFEGKHIRQILTMDENAKRLVNYLAGDGSEPFEESGSMICMTLEPCYTPFSADAFVTDIDKLNCMLQIIQGLRELRSYEYRFINGITAHRDLKFKNVMMENAKSANPTLKLIDFASVKATYNAAADATEEGPLSPNNTAPEDVIEDMPVGEKTDVFALGLMLVELFGVWQYFPEKGNCITNPLHILFEIDKVSDEKAFYEKLFRNNAGGKLANWLERSLKGHTPYWGKVTGIKDLFEAATRLIPEDRIDLNTFEDRLHKLIEKNGGEALVEKSDSKFNLFLFNTDKLSEHREEYIYAATEVMLSQNILPIVIDYRSRKQSDIQAFHSRLDLVSDEEIGGKLRLAGYVEDLKDTTVKGNRYSELFGLLYILATDFLLHKNREKNFGGEIHIFTHTPPTRNNCCRLLYADESVPGGAEILTLYGEDVAKKLDGIKIIVHSHKGATEDWYEVCPI